MIDKFETMVSDGIPVTSRLRTMRIQESVGVRKDSFVKHRLLINSAYAPTDCDDPQDEFNEELDTLVRKSKSLNIAMVVEDHNAQVGKLDALEACLGGQCALLSNKKRRYTGSVLCRQPFVPIQFPAQFTSYNKTVL